MPSFITTYLPCKHELWDIVNSGHIVDGVLSKLTAYCSDALSTADMITFIDRNCRHCPDLAPTDVNQLTAAFSPLRGQSA